MNALNDSKGNKLERRKSGGVVDGTRDSGKGLSLLLSAVGRGGKVEGGGGMELVAKLAAADLVR